MSSTSLSLLIISIKFLVLMRNILIIRISFLLVTINRAVFFLAAGLFGGQVAYFGLVFIDLIIIKLQILQH